MNYAIMLGSNMFIGTTGVLTVADEGKMKEFFRIREEDCARSVGSKLTIDCDIRDSSGTREIKLHKCRPVAVGEGISVDCNQERTIVTREDGTVVISVETLSPDDASLPTDGPVPTYLNSVSRILRITGDFQAGPFRLQITPEVLRIGGAILKGNVSSCNGVGLQLSGGGFSF